MSISSAMSGMSVSYNGVDMEIEEAIDDIFKKLQGFINNTHCEIRSLAMCPEQDANYMEALQIWKQLDTSIYGALDLFSELRSISKQVLGKPSADMKEEVKAQLDKWKMETKQKKEQEKLLKNEAKE